VEELESLEEELQASEDDVPGEEELKGADQAEASPAAVEQPGPEKQEVPEKPPVQVDEDQSRAGVKKSQEPAVPDQAQEEQSRAAAERPQQPLEPALDQSADRPETTSLAESEPVHGPAEQRAAEPEESEEAGRRPRMFEEGERVVVFCLEKESFGVDIYSIRTLVKPQDIFPVPHMPDYLVGLTNLRGEIVPVIDLRTRLGLHVSEYTESTRFVVAEKRDEPICLIVDDVFGIENFSPEHLEEPSGVISSVDTTYLHAIAKSKENLVLLLDLDQVLGEKILEFKK
jgi:purine-binding chemotaxis protein CheW